VTIKITRRKFLVVTGAATAAACASPSGARDGGDASADAIEDREDTLAPDAQLEDVVPETPVDAVDDAFDAAPEAEVDAGSDPNPTGVPENLTLFPLGIMAGDMTAERAMCWTNYTGTLPLVVRVIEMSGARFVRVVYEHDCSVTPAGYVHEDASGLSAGTRYSYVFLVRDAGGFIARSSIGRFRAAVASDSMEVITFAGTSCTHQRGRPFPVLQDCANRPGVDFFVHGGDHVYCDGATTLADYRAKYAENWPSAGMRALHSSMGMYCTLDDHEVDNDFDPETVPAAKLASARAAYFEHRAQRRDPMAPDRIWRSFRWGRTLELFVLDCRTERRPSSRTGANPIYVSRAQIDWLKSSLMASTAVFKFIVNSVPITNFPLIFDIGAADRWEGYAAQRQELLDFIQMQTVTGVWWLSGDFHLASAGSVEPSGPLSTMREILMGPGGNNPNVLFATLGAPQFDFATGTSNYTVLRADPIARTVEVTFVSGTGTELFRRRYTSA